MKSFAKRVALPLAGVVLMGSLLADASHAQCATCPQPTIALSPVVQPMSVHRGLYAFTASQFQISGSIISKLK